MSELVDRRLSPRISCDLQVDYQAGDDDSRMGRITNIGTAGVCLVTQSTTLSVGADLLLHFWLPIGKRAIQAGGTVKWAAQWTAGIALVKLSFQDQDDVWRYYAREAARQREGSPLEASRAIRDPTALGESVLEAWRRFIRENE